jgi:hypothetical protein
MKVPEKLKILIGQLQHHGDIAKIQQVTGYSRYRITQVLEGDDSSDPEVIEAVSDFYESRKETLSDYITD